MKEKDERLVSVEERKRELFEKVCDDLSEVMEEREVNLFRLFFITGWIAGVTEVELSLEEFAEESKKNLEANFKEFSKMLEKDVANYIESLHENEEK